MKMKVGSLFTGIGGIDLGFVRAGFEIAWMCEIDPYARAVLEIRFPGVLIYKDIRELDECVPPVDVLVGGFPCQDISAAGKRKGIVDGTRSRLWGEFLRVIRLLRPRYVVVENVSALLSPHRKEGKPAPISRVLGDLSESGYDAEWEIISAQSVGAPHLRERVFIVAYPQSVGCNTRGSEPTRQKGKFRIDGVSNQVSYSKHSADGVGQGLSWSREQGGLRAEEISRASTVFERGSGTRPQRRDWWAVEPEVCRVAHGVSRRVDRIKCLGNAVVHQCAEYVALRILEREGMLS